MIKGLRTTIYKVGDLNEAKKWYSEILGIEPYFDEPFYAGFNVGGFELGLDPDISDLSNGNSQVAYWGVENCVEAFQKLLKAGAKTHSEPRDVGEKIITASVYDPFENVFGIIENPHFKIENLQ